ncbi:HBR423Wp [Eremothecium sinecaudum]|uniref:HBR423Wp n=1 Tax=Eremothecium sinecaudum TaxID=45286 RepID=A0A120K1F0_9SACH|nr:HBR423Wp [Eremothecium sinecaudum]AMD19324.1 HBR423Wp [Eremothecium sinecaudum]
MQNLSIVLLCLYCALRAALAEETSTAYRTFTVLETKTTTSVVSIESPDVVVIYTTIFQTKTTPYRESPTEVPKQLNATFATQILDAHNELRARHSAPNLVWSDKLYRKAQNYVAKLKTCNGTLVHSNLPYGENLALGYNTTAAVNAWYDEYKEYDYNNPGFSKSTGHFTQLIWANTTTLGCAYILCGPYYGQYTICEYDPPGNIQGEFRDNVKNCNEVVKIN